MSISFAAGQEVEPADLNALVPTYINKAADQTSSSTTNAADNHFANIAIPAGTTWLADLYLELTGSETGDFDSLWSVTGTAAIVARHIRGMPTGETDAANGNASVQVRDYNSSVSNMVDASATSRASYWERLKITGGASGGTITYNWSLNSASGTVTVEADSSWFEMRRVD